MKKQIPMSDIGYPAVAYVGHRYYNGSMTRETPFAEGEYYHIYNRGTNKMNIFNSSADFERFITLLFLANSRETPQYSDMGEENIWNIDRGETLVDIGAYCLMPNHFHILIKTKNDKSVSLFIQRLLTSHSKYFNKKYNRSGSLFQGKSKSKRATEDRYLKYLFAYIHLNPLKIIDSEWKESGVRDLSKTLDYLKKYNYSSYNDYAGENRQESKILNKNSFPEYFTSPSEHINELKEWLIYEI